MSSSAPGAQLERAANRLGRLGITEIESYAWRDLDDPEAGGSELHADEILRRWAEAGVSVTHRTSTADVPRAFERNGYRVIQRGGRFDVFARVIGRQSLRRRPSGTATIEIWNGVPWFGPIWAPHRRVVWMHHVHREMWDDALPVPLSTGGRFVETRVAPLVYRGSHVATLSDSSAAEIRALGIEDLTVIPPGVHERFSRDESHRSTTPHVVIVGRLAPVKRQRLALDALEHARREVASLTVEIIGDGPDRGAIEAWISEHGASHWVQLRGRVDDDELLGAYRRAWIVVSASHAEGWGMSLTEGGACATPCVATDIAGHRGAAEHGRTGLLVSSTARRPAASGPDSDRSDAGQVGDAIATLLADDELRVRLGEAAVDHARGLSWTSVAARHLELLGDCVDQSERDRAGSVE